MTRCLRAQYAPEGNHLEWQAKFQRRGQKADENLVTYVGELRVLADKAYPGWSNDQRLQLVRDQFVQGLRSSTVQLRQMPDTLDEAQKLAIQQELRRKDLAVSAGMARRRWRPAVSRMR